MISLLLKNKIEEKELIDNLLNLSCTASINSIKKDEFLDGFSCIDIFAKTLQEDRAKFKDRYKTQSQDKKRLLETK